MIAPYTVFGWRVADIDSVVAALSGKGVSFERYAHLGDSQAPPTASGQRPSGARVAWFKDPDGNLLSLSQHPG